MDDSFVGELRAFMRWTRETMSCVKGKVEAIEEHANRIERHCAKQNGDIKIVMERERATHDCASKAHDLATMNAKAIVALDVGAKADKALDKERSEEMRGEVKWLRDNIWKLALGGVTLLALIEQVVEIAGKLSGSP